MAAKLTGQVLEPQTHATCELGPRLVASLCLFQMASACSMITASSDMTSLRNMRAGFYVKAGQALLVLSAMKMETSVSAPTDGWCVQANRGAGIA